MSYQCKTCGATHPERPTCFGAQMPAVAAQLNEEDRERRVEISSDQCIVDNEHFFVLGTLDFPVQGSDEVVRWLVWSTLSQPNFERASELWETSGRESEPPYFGWLSNQIPGFPDSLNVKLLVHTEPLGFRPRLEVLDEGHPIWSAQRNGITSEQADKLIHVAQFGEARAPDDSSAESR